MLVPRRFPNVPSANPVNETTIATTTKTPTPPPSTPTRPQSRPRTAPATPGHIDPKSNVEIKSIQITLPSIEESTEAEVTRVSTVGVSPLKVDLVHDVQILTLSDDDEKAVQTVTTAQKEAAPF